MNITPENKPRLLLVDDQAANLHALAAILKTDYAIQVATDGETALQLALGAEAPQLILLDIIMPGISGIEVLRRLRADERSADIPVILVSADHSEQTEISGLDQGADDYITKPVVAAVLRARVRNILLRKRAEAQSRLATHVFKHSGEAMLLTSHDNLILEINPAFTHLTGYTLAEVQGKNPKFLALGDTLDETYQAMWSAIRDRGHWRGEIWERHKDGSSFPVRLSISTVRNRRGEIDFHIANFFDISEQKAKEEKIHHLAHHDTLTGLPNRLHLGIHLAQTLALAHRNRSEVAVLFIDLDYFKNINDTLGHDTGDGLLVEVATRLRQCVRQSDLVARLGGDEFVVVLGSSGSQKTIQVLVDKILERLAQPYEIGRHHLNSSPSIGISRFPHDGDNPDALMKNADTAMYQAKKMGRNNAQFFQSERSGTESDAMRLPT